MDDPNCQKISRLKLSKQSRIYLHLKGVPASSSGINAIAKWCRYG